MGRSMRGVGLAAILGLCAAQPAHSICRVTATGNGGNSGASWAAPLDLPTALVTIGCGEIWVAQGVYKPNTNSPLVTTFNIRPGTALYGGFAGTETLLSQRNWALNLTVLSGDIDNNDTSVDGVLVDTNGIVGSNSKHVVYLDGTTPVFGAVLADTVIDGFTITGGDARFTELADGGGLYCNGDGVDSACSPTLRNLVFSGNRGGHGGGLYTRGTNGGSSHPSLNHVTFTGNFAEYGGGMANHGEAGSANPTLDFVSFKNNRADMAGALWNQGNASPMIRSSTFSGNFALFGAGAIYNNGIGGNANPAFINVTFHGNSTDGRGGVFYGIGSDQVSAPGNSGPTFDNVTITANNALNQGKVMYNITGLGNTYQLLRNVIVWGNGNGTPGTFGDYFRVDGLFPIDHVVFQTSCGSCTNASNADPLLGPLQNNGGAVETRLPGVGGSAIDSGDNNVCIGAGVNSVDARGVARPQGPACDIGAVEFRAADIPDALFANGFEG